MQLQKQARRAARSANQDRHKVVNLRSFNPVMKPGVHILSASTVHNFEQATHVVITTRKVQP